MGFSGIGFWEIVIILVVALLVVGPQRLPEIGRTLGKTFRAIKKAGADLSAGITRELEETKGQQPPPPANPAPPADKPSPAVKPESPGQDDPSRKTGGTPAEK